MTAYPDINYLDFHDFHLRVLPVMLASGNGQRAAEAARELAPLCLRLAESDNAYTYVPAADTITIVAGTEAEAVVELDEASWRQWLDEYSSPVISAEQSGQAEGCSEPTDEMRWQAVLRVMLYRFAAVEMS